MNKRNKMVFMPFIFAGMFLLISYVVMLLWNAIPATIIAGVATITFPKAMGLLVLSKILFGGFPAGRHKSSGGCRNMKDKFRNMSLEEKEKFKEEWKERFEQKSRL